MPRTKASLLMIWMTAAAVAVMFALPYTPARVVQTAAVERGDLLHTVLLSGAAGYAQQQMCVSLQAGMVREVLVKPGQPVKAGQLLFRMDTSAQEQALAALQRARHEGGAWTALASQQLEWMKTEQQLMQSIEAAQIRAQFDGIVEHVYTSEKMYVRQASMLGSVRSAQRCVVASARMTDCAAVSIGAAAVLRQDGCELGAASVESIHAPDETGMQRLVLLPADERQLERCAAGEKIAVELVTEIYADCALIPLSAVEADGRVWFVQDGKAFCERIDISRRSAYAVAASLEWAGRRVIVNPQQLQAGCRVKEAKRE